MKDNINKEVYVVLTCGYDGCAIRHVCSTKEIAIRELLKERDKVVSILYEVIDICLSEQKENKEDVYKITEASINEYKESIAGLSGDDYTKWEFPHSDMLYIEKQEIICI